MTAAVAPRVGLASGARACEACGVWRTFSCFIQCGYRFSKETPSSRELQSEHGNVENCQRVKLPQGSRCSLEIALKRLRSRHELRPINLGRGSNPGGAGAHVLLASAAGCLHRTRLRWSVSDTPTTLLKKASLACAQWNLPRGGLRPSMRGKGRYALPPYASPPNLLTHLHPLGPHKSQKLSTLELRFAAPTLISIHTRSANYKDRRSRLHLLGLCTEIDLATFRRTESS
jgi:hypothetical protein